MKKIQPKIFIDTEVSLESGYTLETGYAIGQTIHFNDTGNEYYHSTDGVWKPVGGATGATGAQGIQGVKGDKLTFADLTPSDIAELQQPANDAIVSIQAVEVSVEQAEAIRVQAEIDRQTNTGTAIQNTGTAIQNANTATTNANNATTNANNAVTLANTKAGLADTAATNADNARLAIQEDLAGKENTANKQNNLTTDGTGVKFPTVDAVNVGLGGKQATLVSGTNIKTVNGTSLLGSGDVSNLIASYTHSGNKEVAVTAVDLATGVFTAVGHGLTNATLINPIINNSINLIGIYPQNYFPTGLFPQIFNLFVVGATSDTFQVSLTNGGAAITYTANANMDLTKWHFESNASLTSITFSNMPSQLKDCKVVINGKVTRYNFGLIGINGNITELSLRTPDKIYGNGYSFIAVQPCSILFNVEAFISCGNYITQKVSVIESQMVSGQTTQINTTKTDFIRVQPIPITTITSITLLNMFLSNGTEIRLYR